MSGTKYDPMIAAEPVAARALAARWYNADQALSSRIGYLAGLIWGDRARNAPVCTQAELDEYRAYLTEARMTNFIDEAQASEAMGYVAIMDARISVQAAFDKVIDARVAVYEAERASQNREE